MTKYPIKKVGTSVMIGNYPTDYTEINEDGTQILHGKAIAWVDMYGDVAGKKLFSNTGKLDTDWDNNCIKFQPGGSINNRNDRLIGNIQNNHQFKIAEGGSLIGVIFHFHWLQDTLNDLFTMKLQTRLLKNGESFNKDAAWNEIEVTTATTDASEDVNVGGDVFPKQIEVGHTNMNQITTFPVLNTDFGLSDTIQYRLARTDNNNGNLLVSFFDTHLPVNSFGSDLPLKKTK